MKVAVFSTKPYDEKFLKAHQGHHELSYFDARLSRLTAPLAQGHNCVCAFVNDQLNSDVLTMLSSYGCKLIALRSAGFNHVDLKKATALGMTVVRVPAYSPYAVAEHAVALILALNRQIHRAFNRVREGNFALEGLLGFDLRAKTIGIIGTGKIGQAFARILSGFGCTLLAYDPYPAEEIKDIVRYTSLNDIFQKSDIISLHCPLTPDTRHIINAQALMQMKRGVMLINTSRGALVDTRAVIDGLKTGYIGHVGLDVYEEEADLFFEDLSNQVIQDDTFSRLLTFPNVIITGHQGFFTHEALHNIAQTTMQNITAFERGIGDFYEVKAA